MLQIRLTIAAILLPLLLGGQSKVLSYLDDNKWTLSALFVAGTFDGTVEILRHDYPAFKRVFPNANDEFWDPDISWRNKWAGGDRANGERFPGSSTVFAWTTDGYHLLRSANKACVITAVVIRIGEKKPLKSILTDFVTHSVAYSAGFTLSYDVIFNH